MNAGRPDERVSLDQLLDAYEEKPSPVRRRAGPRWWALAGLRAAVIGAVLAVQLRILGFAVPYLLLACLVLSVILLRRVLRLLAVAGLPAALKSPLWTLADDPSRVYTSEWSADGQRRAVRRWENRLAWTERDPDRFAAVVRPRIRELVDERLRQRHGLTLAGDPLRARALVGEQVWGFLHGPIGRGPMPRDLADVVTRMEQL